MTKHNIFITGTDTNVGKTVISALLVLATGYNYWKPIQCGTIPCTDRAKIIALTSYNRCYIIPKEHYLFPDPLSPHASSKNVGVQIKLTDFQIPKSHKPFIIEGAGGLLVPLNEQSDMMIDLIVYLKTSLVLVARSTLGTINHTLLSIEAIRKHNIPLLGVILNGPFNPSNKKAIEYYGKTKVITQVPSIEPLNSTTLRQALGQISLRLQDILL